MPPWQGGGDMIRIVRFDQIPRMSCPINLKLAHLTSRAPWAWALQPIICNRSACAAIENYEHELLSYRRRTIAGREGNPLVGTGRHKAGVLSFVMEGIHPHDLGTIVDQEGVAIRTGHHCAMPVMERFEMPATARASLALYNTREDIDALVEALGKAREVLA